MTTLPDADSLYKKFLYAHYDEAAQKAYADGLQPDIAAVPIPEQPDPSLLSPLPEEIQKAYLEQLNTMTEAAMNDFNRIAGKPIYDPAKLLDTVDQKFTPEEIQLVIEIADESIADNDYALTCMELGMLIAQVLREANPKLFWIPQHPYWESILFNPTTGHLFAPLSWAVRKMSSSANPVGLLKQAQLATALANG